MTRPGQTEYASFYETYVRLVTEDDILGLLGRQADELRALAASLPADKEKHRYAEGKWSVRELLGHIGDAERVFGFRAFCFSRGDKSPLPSFDENAYVAVSGYDGQSAKDLADAFASSRDANLRHLRTLDAAAWDQVGTANNNPVSVRALAFIMAGHVRHHLGVLKSRYGIS